MKSQKSQTGAKKTEPRRPTAYDRDQHELICNALKVSPNPTDPGDTAFEAVCELLFKIEQALQAKSLKKAQDILKTPQGEIPFIPIYGLNPQKETPSSTPFKGVLEIC
jgi:hypothetical protein